MSIDIIIVLAVLFFGFILFLLEYFTIDVTALIILSCYFCLGYLTPNEAVSGFSNPAVITIGLLFILSSAIQNGPSRILSCQYKSVIKIFKKLGHDCILSYHKCFIRAY